MRGWLHGAWRWKELGGEYDLFLVFLQNLISIWYACAWGRPAILLVLVLSSETVSFCTTKHNNNNKHKTKDPKSMHPEDLRGVRRVRFSSNVLVL